MSITPDGVEQLINEKSLYLLIVVEKEHDKTRRIAIELQL
jgi:hypothetical protein